MEQSAPEVLPSVAERDLISRLRQLRGRNEMSREQVAKALDWSVSKLLRIENGNIGISTSDLLALARVYSLGDDYTDELVELARTSRRPGVVAGFSDVLTKEFSSWIEFELAAAEIHHYEPKLIPGPLQVNGYATSILTAYNPGRSQSVIKKKVEARRIRAQYLFGVGGPRLWYMIDEAALHRGVGNELSNTQDYSVMRRVFKNIRLLNTMGRVANGEEIEADLNPNVSVQIMPFGLGAYGALSGPFEVLEFKDPRDNYMMYQETPVGDFVSDEQHKITSYLESFEEMQSAAPPVTKTNELIDQVEALMVNGQNGLPLS